MWEHCFWRAAHQNLQSTKFKCSTKLEKILNSTLESCKLPPSALEGNCSEWLWDLGRTKMKIYIATKLWKYHWRRREIQLATKEGRQQVSDCASFRHTQWRYNQVKNCRPSGDKVACSTLWHSDTPKSFKMLLQISIKGPELIWVNAIYRKTQQPLIPSSCQRLGSSWE